MRSVVCPSAHCPALTALLPLLELLEQITLSALNTVGTQADNPPLSEGILTLIEIVEPPLDELLAACRREETEPRIEMLSR